MAWYFEEYVEKKTSDAGFCCQSVPVLIEGIIVIFLTLPVINFDTNRFDNRVSLRKRQRLCCALFYRSLSQENRRLIMF